MLVPLHEDFLGKVLFEVGRSFRHTCSAQFVHHACALLGADDSDIIVAPRGSKRRRVEQDAGSEFLIRTDGLLSLLVTLSLMKRRAAQRDLCLATLEAFLRKCDDGATPPEVLISTHIDAARGLCDARPQTQGMCPHKCCVAESMCDDLMVLSARRLAEYLLTVASSADCPAALATYRSLVAHVSRTVDKVCDVEQDVTELKKLQGFRQSGRQVARVDYDYKTVIVNRTVKESRAKSGAAALRVDGLDPSAARRWEEAFMLSYSLTAPREMSGTRIWSVTSDGARLGDPPEETICYFAYSGCLDKSSVWPPQVPTQSKYMNSVRNYFFPCGTRGA